MCQNLKKTFLNYVNQNFLLVVPTEQMHLHSRLNLNLKQGSEVIIPAMTYCSTAFSVINANLKPILVDTKYMSPLSI